MLLRFFAPATKYYCVLSRYHSVNYTPVGQISALACLHIEPVESELTSSYTLVYSRFRFHFRFVCISGYRRYEIPSGEPLLS